LDDTPYKRGDRERNDSEGAGNGTVRFGPREVIEYSAERWPEYKTSIKEPDQALTAGASDLR
jgi:hypothetical protein